jgi:hypothetical protein
MSVQTFDSGIPHKSTQTTFTEAVRPRLHPTPAGIAIAAVRASNTILEAIDGVEAMKAGNKLEG